MVTVRRVTYESLDDQGYACKKWIEGDVSGWVDEGDALAYHGGNQVIRIWKRKIIGDVEYEKNSFCFISTAVYSNMGFDDDCSDLKTLRDFRDNFLLKTTHGKKMVDEYYSIAPSIVHQIDNSEEKENIYNNIYYKYIINVVNLINKKEFDLATEQYEKMVNELFTKYSIENIDNN